MSARAASRDSYSHSGKSIADSLKAVNRGTQLMITYHELEFLRRL